MIFLDEVDSTNTYLKARIADLPDGAAVTAEMQTAGRGRRGHTWLADNGMLPLSVLLKAPEFPATVTLCAGVAVCQALESLPAVAKSGLSAGLKWPNDVIIGGYKVCGILCESVCFGERIDVVCGIGVNVSQTEDFFRAAGLPHGASLKMLTNSEIDKRSLAEDIAARVVTLCAKGFNEVYEEYKARCVTLGKQVKLVENEKERIAFAEDISEKGYLVCTAQGERFEVNSGEVSVRGLLGYI